MVRNVLFALVLAACGSHSGASAEAEHHDMETMPADLAQFHDVLAPHWHAAAGPARRQGTCDAIGAMEAGADGVVKARASSPEAKQLRDAVAELSRACATRAADAEFDAAFGKVHESFHHALEAANR
jgi:hypothetical protein